MTKPLSQRTICHPKLWLGGDKTFEKFPLMTNLLLSRFLLLSHQQMQQLSLKPL